jgi:hypothetical protein
MTEQAVQQEEKAPAVPVSFKVTKRWKRKRSQPGLTSMATRALGLSEALDVVLDELDDEAVKIAYEGEVTTITIDWAKVPVEVRDPFRFGVRR